MLETYTLAEAIEIASTHPIPPEAIEMSEQIRIFKTSDPLMVPITPDMVYQVPSRQKLFVVSLPKKIN